MHSSQSSVELQSSNATLSVDVIIPTKNRPQDLEDTVKTLLNQSILPAQLIIVDQSDDSESERRVKALCDSVTSRLKLIYILDRSIQGGAVARNRAMDLVVSDLMLFLDDDVFLEQDFIEQIVDSYRLYPQAGGISGIITNYKRPPLPFRIWRSVFMRGPFHDSRQDVYWRAESLRASAPIKVASLGGGLMSFRSAIVGQKRFDENMRGVSDGEDVDFSYRLRTELRIAPKARLIHNSSPVGRLKDHFLRRQARAQYFLYRKNWNHGIVNRLAFGWLNLGYGLIASAGTLRRGSLEPWRALFAGISDAAEIFSANHKLR